MKKDRIEIYNIINKMLNNQDENETYPISTTFIKLEHYIERVRLEAIGWTHAELCNDLDNGEDPRLADIPFLLERAKSDLDVKEV